MHGLRRRDILFGAAALPLMSRGAVAQSMAGMQMPGSSEGASGDHCTAATQVRSAKPVPGATRKLTIAWNENAICTAGGPVARERGFFKRYNVDVDYVNFSGSTDQLLEALSTGKADGGPGMALRWLKPLSQGFDVKLVSGLHAGCMYLLAPPAGRISSIADLRGKAIGVTDIGGPDRNFFAIRAKEAGLDPDSDIQWRQYPADLLGLAVQRGEVAAITGGDPLAYLQKRQFELTEIDSNMRGEWGKLACCVIGLRGSLIRDEPVVAAAVTAAILEAGAWVACNPAEAARIFKPFAPKASVEDLTAMLNMQGHHHQVLSGDFRSEIVRYADALKQVGVFRPSLDSARYAQRVTQDVFAA